MSVAELSKMRKIRGTSPPGSGPGVLDKDQVANVLQYLSHVRQADEPTLDAHQQAQFDYGRELILQWLAGCLLEA